MNAPFRPALRYLGGKWKLAPWIIGHFPRHRVYVEPFGGAASVLLQKPRSAGECYNDLCGEVVNLFRVLRDPADAGVLVRQLSFTPFAREEYDAAFAATDDPIERARRLVARSYMGHGSSAAVSQKSTGFRASLVNRRGALPAGEWPSLPPALEAICARLQGVLIEQRPALSLIDRYDAADTLFYLDPPYVADTRSAKRRGGKAFHAYNHELDDAAHVALLERVKACEASVLVSGYACELYDDLLTGWRRETRATHADGALDREEVLWISPSAALPPVSLGALFDINPINEEGAP